MGRQKGGVYRRLDYRPKNNSNDIRQKYWAYLQQWLGITPYVYGISGRQWDDVPRQAEKLSKEHGNEVDAVVVFMGTNDFNAGVPVGEWYVETEDTVTAAVHGKKQVYKRKKRTPVMTGDTFKGRINIGISKLKTLFPDKQIVLLTPLHRLTPHSATPTYSPTRAGRTSAESISTLMLRL